MSTRVYVGRLPNSARERDVERFFKGYGRIREILLKNGYGFVEFDDARDADDAVYDLHGKTLHGDRLIVEHAKQPGSGRRRDSRDSYSSRSRRPPPTWIDRQMQPSRYGVPQRTPYRLIVENLSSRVSWQDLKDYMRQAGEVTYADAHKEEKNVGIVEFASRSDMKKAIEKLDGLEVNGRKIRLVEDKPSSRKRSASYSSRSRSRSRSRSHGHSSKRSRKRSDSRKRSNSRKSRSGHRSGSDRRSASGHRSGSERRSASGHRSGSDRRSASSHRSGSQKRSVSRKRSVSNGSRSDRSASKRRSLSNKGSPDGRRSGSRKSDRRSGSRKSDRRSGSSAKKSVSRSRSRSRSQSKHSNRSRSASRSRSRSISKSPSKSRSASPETKVKENGRSRSASPSRED